MIFFWIPFRTNTLSFLLFCNRRNLNFFTGSLLQSQSKLLGHFAIFLHREFALDNKESHLCDCCNLLILCALFIRV